MSDATPKPATEDLPESTSDATTPTATTTAAAGLSREALEEEVSQVLGTFNSWWGGVKKQASSLEDHSDVVCHGHLDLSSRPRQDCQAGADRPRTLANDPGRSGGEDPRTTGG